jgi:hypothetical protein
MLRTALIALLFASPAFAQDSTLNSLAAASELIRDMAIQTSPRPFLSGGFRVFILPWAGKPRMPGTKIASRAVRRRKDRLDDAERVL